MKRLVLVLALGGGLAALLVSLWFMAQDPDELHAWMNAPDDEPLLKAAPGPLEPPKPPWRSGPHPCEGLTWAVRAQQGTKTWVGSAGSFGQAKNPCYKTQALLCFRPGSLAEPDDLKPWGGNENPRWSGGTIALLPEVSGLEVTSRQTANQLCVEHFGDGWFMAQADRPEGFVAEGELPRAAVFFWVASKEPGVNLWDR